MNPTDIIPDSDPSSNEEALPSEIVERANEVRNNLLSVKSRDKHAINIHDHAGVIAFLKQKHKGYTPKKSKVLNTEEIDQFITEAPNCEFLAIKVALIFGVSGARRRQELCDTTIDNIIDKGDMIIVNVPRTKNDKPRSFIVQGQFYELYKTYASLRPPKVTTQRFFLNYRKGKCTSQVIGINSLGNMAEVVATYLKLDNPELYTGHTFRRTAAIILADTGANNRELKNLGGWKSDAVTEGYIENSIQNKKRVGNQIMNAIIKQPPHGEKIHRKITVLSTTIDV
ncbi:uncharacterized protein [Chelonus insularis]|uniref:uncharacterized protein n=1 Tax=Chelonus insularis TaxID=460826 RepID=UPI00158AC509|nr:uncharacterized protein LOC118066279 [Chelonus insularis]